MTHTNAPRRFLTRAAALCLLLAVAVPAPAQRDAFTRNNTQFLYAFRDAAAKPSQSTVRVLCDGKNAALGTVVGPDGWILTKYSELKGAITCQLKDGKKYDAKLVGVQEQYDLAMLKIDAKGLTPVTWSDSKTAPVGNWLVSAGTGDDPAAVGVMSVASRTLSSREVARTGGNPASSGYLGIGLEEAEGAPRITQVMPKSAAAKAGLKEGDKILTLNGKAIANPDELMAAMGRTKPGDLVTLKIKRGDDEMELKATLDKRPSDSRGDFQNRMGSELSKRRFGFPTFFQHDTVVKPEDCGGPVADLDGHVLGINISRSGRTESYAIPSEAIKPLLADLKSGKLAPPKTEAVAKGPTAEEKLAQAKESLQKAEAAMKAARKKADDAKAALQKAEAERAEAEKKAEAAREALEKAEKEAKKSE